MRDILYEKLGGFNGIGSELFKNILEYFYSYLNPFLLYSPCENKKGVKI